MASPVVAEDEVVDPMDGSKKDSLLKIDFVAQAWRSFTVRLRS